MRLKDKEIEKMACFKVGKFGNEELDEDDLKKIEEMNVNNRKFSGEEKNVSLQELTLFPNIKRISLQYFTIDDSAAEILSNLNNLESLQLASCKLSLKSEIKNDNLRSLELNACNITDYSTIYAPNALAIVGSNNIRLDRIKGKENIERMYLQNSKVRGFRSITDCGRLKVLNLDGSSVDDKKVLEKIKLEIPVSQKEEYLPIR